MSKVLHFYGQRVEEDGNTWYTHIKKPIYGTCIALNQKVLDCAIEQNKTLVVSCPNGAERISPAEFKKKSMRIEKVFRIPDQPIVLYQKSITPLSPIKPKDNSDKNYTPLQAELF